MLQTSLRITRRSVAFLDRYVVQALGLLGLGFAAYVAHSVPQGSIPELPWLTPQTHHFVQLGTFVIAYRAAYMVGMPLIRSLRGQLASEASTRTIGFDKAQDESLLLLGDDMQQVKRTQEDMTVTIATLVKLVAAQNPGEEVSPGVADGSAPTSENPARAHGHT